MIKNVSLYRVAFKDFTHKDIQYTDFVIYEIAYMWQKELEAKLGFNRAWLEPKN